MLDLNIIHQDMMSKYNSVLNVSVYGSSIEEMIGINVIPNDIDIIVVQDDKIIIDSDVEKFVHNGMEVEIQFMNESDFIADLKELHPKYFLSSFSTPEYMNHLLSANRRDVRHAVGRITDLAYGRGFKKLTVPESFDERLGLKNLWHSVKFPYYAKWFYTNSSKDAMLEECTKDVFHLNEIHANIFKIYKNQNGLDELREYIKPVYNSIKSDFRKIFPKN